MNVIVRRGIIFRLVIIIALCIVFFQGCSKKEVIVQGIPLTVWAERLTSEDPAVRADALDVIATVGKKAKTIELPVRQIARNDKFQDIRLKAIDALDAMGAVTGEFDAFVSERTAPLIPEESEFSEELTEAMFSDKVSGETDIEMLQEIMDEKLDSVKGMKLDDLDFPIGEEDRADWAQKKLTEEIGRLSNELSNPAVLTRLMSSEDVLERRFAIQKLIGQLAGKEEDFEFEIPSDILGALSSAREDSDSLIQALAEEAFGRWSDE